jgi:hypothetical protein
MFVVYDFAIGDISPLRTCSSSVGSGCCRWIGSCVIRLGGPREDHAENVQDGGGVTGRRRRGASQWWWSIGRLVATFGFLWASRRLIDRRQSHVIEEYGHAVAPLVAFALLCLLVCSGRPR